MSDFYDTENNNYELDNTNINQSFMNDSNIQIAENERIFNEIINEFNEKRVSNDDQPTIAEANMVTTFTEAMENYRRHVEQYNSKIQNGYNLLDWKYIEESRPSLVNQLLEEYNNKLQETENKLKSIADNISLANDIIKNLMTDENCSEKYDSLMKSIDVLTCNTKNLNKEITEAIKNDNLRIGAICYCNDNATLTKQLSDRNKTSYNPFKGFIKKKLTRDMSYYHKTMVSLYTNRPAIKDLHDTYSILEDENNKLRKKLKLGPFKFATISNRNTMNNTPYLHHQNNNNNGHHNRIQNNRMPFNNGLGIQFNQQRITSVKYNTDTTYTNGAKSKMPQNHYYNHPRNKQ